MDLKRVHVQGKPPLKSSNRFSFLMIVNRIGELVWVYVPAIEDQPFYSYINAQQVSPGEYGFVLGKKDGYFAVIDHLGNHTKRFISRQKSIDLPMHHDFILDDQQNHLVTISNGMSKIMEKGVEVSYLTNNIVKVNLATRKWKELIDFAKYFPVGKDPFWNENKQKDRFVGWGEESADHDYIHANSLNRVTNEGVLTALKHLDRVVMLSSDFSSVQWVAGPSPEDDFRVTGKARFSHPHSPWLRENNRLIMFDNGFRTRKSRLLEVQLDKSKKEAIFNWEWYPPEKLFSSNRSSVLPISDRRLLAYFVSPKRNGKTESKDREHDYLYEIEYPSGRIAASMKLSYPVPSAGFHALPINAIGEDQPYRGKLPRNP